MEEMGWGEEKREDHAAGRRRLSQARRQLARPAIAGSKGAKIGPVLPRSSRLRRAFCAVVLAARAWCTRETNLRMIRRHHTPHAQRLRASPKSVDIAFLERTRKIYGKPGHSVRAGPPGDARATNTAQATPLGYAAGLERAGYAAACGLSWARFEGVAYAIARAMPLDSSARAWPLCTDPHSSSRAVSKGA